jgi:hypothetical protein
MKYTVNRGSQEIGKFELADMKALMNAGVLLPTDYFWFQGMPKMKPVSSLFASQAHTPPQVSAPAQPPAMMANPDQIVLTKLVGPSCPSCSSSDVTKAKAAYESSLLQHSFATSLTDTLKEFTVGAESINKSGAMCAPPEKPEKTDNASGYLLFAITIGVVGLVCAIGFAYCGLCGLIYEGIALGIGAVLLVPLSLLLFKSWKKGEAEIEADYQKSLRIHKSQMADYVRTWRCNKCGVMYMV